ncbi:uncharacterized protein [Diabrotica undecimpunctata]|uniref:uncharacterized protein n=1 Tax=Diabrotica undecimpunctata TaxID=50387 RepID=UPI003B637C3D
MLLALIRERFWPISGRNICKGIARNCISCIRSKPIPGNYIMGELPATRITQYLPFINIGTDFAGPFLLKGRLKGGSKLIKSYVCIFVCLSTKAVHLEVTSDLTTACFLAAFRRFVSRRGKPSKIYSDNGKTDVGAKKELQSLNNFLKNQAISEEFNSYFTEQGIDWHFIPFRAIWEAGVKSFKFHFKRVVGETHLNLE